MISRTLFALFILLSTLAYAGEHRLLLTGLSLHEHAHNQFGERYNAYNVGIGYEKNWFETYSRWYFTTNAMLFNDSFENPQLTVGFGHAKRFAFSTADVAIGLAGFVGVKKLYESDDHTGESGKYGLMGGLAPVIVLYRRDWSLNLVYVPSVKVRDYDLTGFAFAYLGWRF
jgi:hypothetical protein